MTNTTQSAAHLFVVVDNDETSYRSTVAGESSVEELSLDVLGVHGECGESAVGSTLAGTEVFYEGIRVEVSVDRVVKSTDLDPSPPCYIPSPPPEGEGLSTTIKKRDSKLKRKSMPKHSYTNSSPPSYIPPPPDLAASDPTRTRRKSVPISRSILSSDDSLLEPLVVPEKVEPTLSDDILIENISNKIQDLSSEDVVLDSKLGPKLTTIKKAVSRKPSDNFSSLEDIIIDSCLSTSEDILIEESSQLKTKTRPLFKTMITKPKEKVKEKQEEGPPPPSYIPNTPRDLPITPRREPSPRELSVSPTISQEIPDPGPPPPPYIPQQPILVPSTPPTPKQPSDSERSHRSNSLRVSKGPRNESENSQSIEDRSHEGSMDQSNGSDQQKKKFFKVGIPKLHVLDDKTKQSPSRSKHLSTDSESTESASPTPAKATKASEPLKIRFKHRSSGPPPPSYIPGGPPSESTSINQQSEDKSAASVSDYFKDSMESQPSIQVTVEDSTDNMEPPQRKATKTSQRDRKGKSSRSQIPPIEKSSSTESFSTVSEDLQGERHKKRHKHKVDVGPPAPNYIPDTPPGVTTVSFSTSTSPSYSSTSPRTPMTSPLSPSSSSSSNTKKKTKLIDLITKPKYDSEPTPGGE